MGKFSSTSQCYPSSFHCRVSPWHSHSALGLALTLIFIGSFLNIFVLCSASSDGKDMLVAGVYSIDFGNQSCVQCTAGTFANTSNTNCSLPCLDGFCSSLEECTECSPGHVQPVNGSDDCDDCPIGTYQPFWKQLNCMSCTQGYFNNMTASVHCFPCPQGAFSSDPESSTCEKCQPGFHQNKTGKSKCEPCQPGSVSNDTGAVDCVLCEPGSAMFNSTQCSPCNVGYNASIAGLPSCGPCPLGTYCNETNCIMCENCGPGRETLTGASTHCTTCRSGYCKKDEGPWMCKSCDDGWYQPARGKTSCMECPLNYFCPCQSCQPVICPKAAFCPKGSMKPHYCDPTFFYIHNEKCVANTKFILVVSAGGLVVAFIVILAMRKLYRLRQSRVEQTPLAGNPQTADESQWLLKDTMLNNEPVYSGL